MMDREVRNFIIKILIAGSAMIVLGWVVFTYLIPEKYLQVLPWMLAFFTLTALLTYVWQVALSKKKMGQFTRSSMIISLLRLMLYSVFAIVYLANNKENAVVFVVCLIFVYSVYTILEVSDLARIVKRR